MPVGFSLFLIAIGAILTFAVTTVVEGIALDVVGIILMIVGGVGLLWSVLIGEHFGFDGIRRKERVVEHERDHV